MRITEKFGSNIQINVPLICQNCVFSSLDFLVKRKTGITPNIVYKEATALLESREELPCKIHNGEHHTTKLLKNREVPSTQAGATNLSTQEEAANKKETDKQETSSNNNVLVGIVGNTLLCFDEFLNENLADLLHKLNATPVWPEPKLLDTDDVTYIEQLDLFAQKGVDVVLYLQSFSCLKSHISSRGSHNMFKKRYPNMPIHVLDYDPESSSLNRENRIRLAIEAAFDAKNAD